MFVNLFARRDHIKSSQTPRTAVKSVHTERKNLIYRIFAEVVTSETGVKPERVQQSW
jgi:hypothetical protein